MEEKQTDSLVKKLQVLQSVKKVLLTVFWDMKGPITIDFIEKGTTVVCKEGHADSLLGHEKTHHYCSLVKWVECLLIVWETWFQSQVESYQRL